jgi:hemerythrin superfamily protein
MATRAKTPNAIDLLKEQHREVEALFSEIEKAEDDETKEELFVQIADKLAMHARIEEMHFYPASKEEETEDLLLEAVEEHLSAKRVIADLLDLDPGAEEFDAKIKVLKELVEHHVGEEEKELFPKVKKVLSEDELIALAQEMMSTWSELEGKDPRLEVPAETAEAVKP